MAEAPKLPDLLAGVRITDAWVALGGGPLRHRRGTAFWRHGDGFNVSLSDQKGCWHDFVTGEGGGVLDLVQKVRDCDRKGALRWLADFAGVPLDSKPLTAAQKRDYARARRGAKPLARAALWWWQAWLSELEDRKRECFHAASVDTEKLAATASLLYRLQNLSPDAIVQHYLHARAADPHGTRQLVRIGETWERACKAVIEACLTGERWGVACAA